jgi:predicted transcriptional regulator
LETQNSTIPTEQPSPAHAVEELRLDVAWEARHGIADRIGCRECAKFVRRLGGKDGHLWLVHQMTSPEYRAIYPGARLFSFADIASNHNRNVMELMANFAADYFLPKEIIEGRTDMEWERSHNIADAVMCRECGRRVRAELSVHLKLKHKMGLAEYRSNWPAAPTRSDVRRKQGVNWWANHPEEARGKNKRNNDRKRIELHSLRALAAEKPNAPARQHKTVGAPRKDDEAAMIVRLKDVNGLSWSQIMIRLNAGKAMGERLSQEGYRSLYRSRNKAAHG